MGALQGVRVLAVDDNPTNLEILCEQLASLGMNCDSQIDATAVIGQMRAAAVSPYKLVLVDMKMPAMSGLDLARAIRADAEFDGTVLILLTSQSEAGELSRAYAGGFSAVLHKPVRLEELAEAIERSLALGGSGAAPARAVSKADERGDLNGLHVLLAEDNPVNQSLALAHLHRLGCQVTLANNGREAITACQQSSFDLILMDCQMPEMDGYEATRRIRAMEAGQQRTPIIAVTANALHGDRENCLACGMDDFLPKPYKQQQLRALLKQWALDDSNGGANTDRTGSPAADATESQQAPVLDPGVLDELAVQVGDDSPALIGELVDIYLGNAPQLLATMETALAAGDAKELMRAAHTLKSSSASLGAQRLSALSKRIEHATREGNLSGMEAPIAQAKHEFSAAAAALRARRG